MVQMEKWLKGNGGSLNGMTKDMDNKTSQSINMTANCSEWLNPRWKVARVRKNAGERQRPVL